MSFYKETAGISNSGSSRNTYIKLEVLTFARVEDFILSSNWYRKTSYESHFEIYDLIQSSFLPLLVAELHL